MLIEFQVENFRSFKDRQTFSMVAGQFPEHIDSNTFEPPLQGFGRLLRAAAIYGPNAGGKTNLLLAVKFMKDFVIESASTTSGSTPFSPFKLNSACTKQPSEFQITFAQGTTRYEYGFALGPERVEKEWLVEYVRSGSRTRGRTLFNRKWNRKTKKVEFKYGSYLKGQPAVWRDATRPDALFLSTAIQLNSTQLRPVYDWFQKRLVVIAGGVQLNKSLTLELLDQPGGKERVLPFLKEADLGIADFWVKREPIPHGGVIVGKGEPMLTPPKSGTAPTIVTVTISHKGDSKTPVGFDFSEESSGTQILFKTAGAWLNVLSRGEVLLFDEIDTNMHPTLLRFLIGRFQSSKANLNNAQLICSTHNTSILDRNLFRRDQIWFMEKQSNGSSRLYPLTDFSPRNDEAFERAYMKGRYGAQPVLTDAAD